MTTRGVGNPPARPRSGRRAAGVRWISCLVLANLLLYLVWVPFSALPGGLPATAYLSEMLARGQRWSDALRLCDAAAGLVAVFAGGGALAWLCPADRTRWFRAAWAGFAVFGVATVVDTVMPMVCAPTVDRACRRAEHAGTLPLTHYLHTVSSSVAVTGAMVTLFGAYLAATRGGVALPRWTRCGMPSLTLLSLLTFGVVVAPVDSIAPGLWQRAQLLVLAWCFLLLTADLRGLPAPAPGPAPDGVASAGELVAVGEGRLHVRDEGNRAGPVVVFLSGLGDAWFNWDRVVGDLVDSHRVVRVDRPGLGRSDLEAGTPTLVGEARRVDALLDALRVDKPVTVVGHSMGGMHAEAFTRLYPGRVAGLVLVDASQVCPARRAPLVPSGLRARAGTAVGALAAGLGLPALAGAAVRAVVTRALAVTRRAGRSPHARAVFSSARVATAVVREELTFGWMLYDLGEVRAQYPVSSIPVRVIVATGRIPTRRSRESSVAGSQALTALFGGAELIVLTDSAHLVALDRPDAVVTAVRQVTRTGKVLGRHEGDTQ